MDPETKAKAYMLIAIIVLMAVIGACVIFGLTRAWARHNRRLRNRKQRHREKREAAPAIDPWQASGRRLLGHSDQADPLHDPTDPSLDLPPEHSTGLMTESPPKTGDDYSDEPIDEHDFDDEEPWHDDQTWRGDQHPDISEDEDDEDDDGEN